jgi:hypothetical protein
MVFRTNSARICLLLLIALAVFSLTASLSSVQAAERNWLRVQYDPDVQAQTRVHVEAAVDLVADMLTEYKASLAAKRLQLGWWKPHRNFFR